MALRTATRRWADLDTFLREYPTTLRVGALVLPAEALEGQDPAPELKVDLLLPIVGRVGPVDAQVIARLPDGGVALRIVETPSEVRAAFRQVVAEGERLRAAAAPAPPAATVPPSPEEPPTDARIAALEGRIAELEAENTALRARLAGAAPAETPRGRGLALPDTGGAPPVLEGALGDTSLRDAVLVLASEKATGLLTVKAKGPDGAAHTRWGIWSRGGPVGWRTDPLDEAEVLGVLLWRANRLTREQLEQSLAMMEERGIRQGEALVEMGALAFGDLVVYLQRQAEFVFQRTLAERDGTWTFHAAAELPEKYLAPPVRVAGVMFRGMLAEAKDTPAEEIAAVLRPHGSQYVCITEAGEALLAEMKLSNEEQKFFAILRKAPNRLRDLFTLSNLSRAQTATMAWALSAFGIVEFRITPGEPAAGPVPTSSAAAPPPRPPVPAPEAAPATTAGPTPPELDVWVKRSAAGTLFERLGVHWISTRADVDGAWTGAEAALRPERATATWGAAHARTAATVLETVRAAWTQLRDDAQRRAYRLSVVGESTVTGSAAILARKAQGALERGARDEAIACAEKACELAPGAHVDLLARVRA
jgi:hypothetical protein